MRIFSFAHSVFKRLVLQTRKNHSLFGKWLKLKELAGDNYKLGKYDGKLCKLVENAVGKGEIARYEQFVLFPVFSNCSADT